MIVPLRLSPSVFEGALRLQRILDAVPADLFEVIVVDYGSASAEAAQLREIVGAAAQATLIRVDNELDPFRAGHARNIGAQHAKSAVIMFNDVDCLASTSMYRRIAAEASARRLDVNAYDFFALPIAFLTYEGVTEYLALQSSVVFADTELYRRIIRTDPEMVSMMAYTGSTVVVNRLHYLALGGTSHEFHGHGGEDYEIKHRLAAYNPISTKPLDYYLNARSNQIRDYVGFRAYLSLYGLEALYQGLYMVHLWHPKRVISGPDNTNVYHQTGRNFALLKTLMQRFDKEGAQPAALPDMANPLRTLVLCRANSHALESIRHALPALGQFRVVNETTFTGPQALIETVEREGFDRVLFLNPYGNEHRLELFRAVRKAKIPYLVNDRGALPRSWFFDPNGFNADSTSYAPQLWDKHLSESAEREVDAYVAQLRLSAETLEVNAPPKTAEYWHSRFGVGSRKVLFVPLQRPTDTVTRYFGGNVGSYENFYMWVSSIAAALNPAEWLIVAKKHPNEAATPSIPGVVFAPADAHVHDLIDLASAVLLLNSGVGLLSLAFGTPVIACGQAFYGHPGLAHSVGSIEQAIAAIKGLLPPDSSKVKRFLHHLLTRVYSFGEATYVDREQSDGSKVTAVRSIRFDIIRIPPSTTFYFGKVRRPAALDSLLLSSFGGADALRRAKDSPLLKGQQPSLSEMPKAVPARHKPEPTAEEAGLAAFHAGRYAEASASLGRAAAADPKNVDLLRSLAEAFYSAGEPAKGHRVLKQARQLAPRHRRLYKRMLVMRYPWLAAVLRRLRTPSLSQDDPAVVTVHHPLGTWPSSPPCMSSTSPIRC